MTGDEYHLPEVASVHEKTVQDAQRHADEHQAHRRYSPRRHRGGRVDTFKVDDDVMAVALKLAGGDARRLQINKDGSVYVR
jgi:hypothetical protein